MNRRHGSNRRGVRLSSSAPAAGSAPPAGIVTDGLTFHLDASDPASYPGTGTTWTDLINSGSLTFAAQPGYRAAPGFVNFNSALAAGNEATGSFAAVSSIAKGALEIWFRWKMTQSAASGTLMTTVDGAGNWVHLGQASAGESFEFFNNEGTLGTANYLAMDYMNTAGSLYFRDNEWHQLVVVVTGGGASDPTTIYLDGNLVPPIGGGTTGVKYRHGSNTSEVLWNAAGVTLGRLAPSSNKYTSDIAIIRMYDRDGVVGSSASFSAAEVTQNYSVDGPKFQTFYPDTIGKLTLWLDPDDASTRTMAGLNVSVLTDKAFAVPAAQAAGATGPTLESVGGRNWMKFNGTSQNLDLTHSGGSSLIMDNLGTSKDYEVHAVIRADVAVGTDATNAYKNDQAFGGSSGYWGLYAKRGALVTNVILQAQQYAVPKEGIDWATVASGSPQVGVKHVLGASHGGGVFYSYLDGAADSVGGTASAGMTYTNNQIRFGGGIWGAYYAGLIGEVLVFNEPLTVSERNDVLDYLRTKWGTP